MPKSFCRVVRQWTASAKRPEMDVSRGRQIDRRKFTEPKQTPEVRYFAEVVITTALSDVDDTRRKTHTLFQKPLVFSTHQIKGHYWFYDF